MTGIQIAKSTPPALAARVAILAMAALAWAAMAQGQTNIASEVSAGAAPESAAHRPDSAPVDNLRIPDPRFRECIFRQAGVTAFVKDLDQLDRDFIFMRAMRYGLEEFQASKTETRPATPYGKLIPEQNARKLLELVKTSKRCGKLTNVR